MKNSIFSIKYLDGDQNNYYRPISYDQKIICHVYYRTTGFLKWCIVGFQKNFPCNAISYNFRPWLWKLVGVKAKGAFRVGYDVYFDPGKASHIFINEGAWISSRCTILCHKRDIFRYAQGDVYASHPTKVLDVHIGKNVAIGMESMIMPGVTIGEGAVIGSGSLVTKDIPAWSLAVGRPAKPAKVFSKNSQGDIMHVEK